MTSIKLLTAKCDHIGIRMPIILDDGIYIWVRQKDGAQDFGPAVGFNWALADLPTYVTEWAKAEPPEDIRDQYSPEHDIDLDDTIDPTPATTEQWDWMHAERGFYWVIDGDYETVCDLYHEKDGKFFPFPQAEARARLISQAPAMLEICRAYRTLLSDLAALEDQETRPDLTISNRLAWAVANTIIEKAEGKS